jgi:hypothetical protein
MLHSLAQAEFSADASATPDGAPLRRVPGRPFKPGTSGNPGGKPRRSVDGQSLPELARAHTGDALRALAGIVNDPKELTANRIAAANVILQRGWGDIPRAPSEDREMRFVVVTHPDEPNAPRAPGVIRSLGDPPELTPLTIENKAHATPSQGLAHDGQPRVAHP